MEPLLVASAVKVIRPGLLEWLRLFDGQEVFCLSVNQILPTGGYVSIQIFAAAREELPLDWQVNS